MLPHTVLQQNKNSNSSSNNESASVNMTNIENTRNQVKVTQTNLEQGKVPRYCIYNNHIIIQPTTFS